MKTPRLLADPSAVCHALGIPVVSIGGEGPRVRVADLEAWAAEHGITLDERILTVDV